MSFNERIKLLRKERNLTQEQLAEEAGLSKSSISMYENGNRVPELETFESLADFFNVDLDYLKGKSDIRRKDDFARDQMMAENFSDDPDIRKIERARRNMPQQKKEDMINMLKISFREYFVHEDDDDE